jgi:hypothetical protein
LALAGHFITRRGYARRDLIARSVGDPFLRYFCNPSIEPLKLLAALRGA